MCVTDINGGEGEKCAALSPCRISTLTASINHLTALSSLTHIRALLLKLTLLRCTYLNSARALVSIHTRTRTIRYPLHFPAPAKKILFPQTKTTKSGIGYENTETIINLQLLKLANWFPTNILNARD